MGSCTQCVQWPKYCCKYILDYSHTTLGRWAFFYSTQSHNVVGMVYVSTTLPRNRTVTLPKDLKQKPFVLFMLYPCRLPSWVNTMDFYIPTLTWIECRRRCSSLKGQILSFFPTVGERSDAKIGGAFFSFNRKTKRKKIWKKGSLGVHRVFSSTGNVRFFTCVFCVFFFLTSPLILFTWYAYNLAFVARWTEHYFTLFLLQAF